MKPEDVTAEADRCRNLNYPGGFEGRGVVIGAGGEKFFRCGWVAFSMLRWLGCNLPVQFWHLGRGEMDPQMRAVAESVGIEVIDGRAVAAALEKPPRILNGWELKPFSVLHSRFKEVLYLDADCVPLKDPEYLFDDPAYLEHGSIFWPDLPPAKRKEWLPPVVWHNVGLEYRDEPDFESGQFLIDKERCWSELNLTMWLNEHSDWCYKFVFGDKSTYHLAWRKLGRDYAMPKKCGWSHPAILQHDMQGRRIFEHCCQGKEKLAGAQRISSLTWANQCVDAARVLQEKWPYRIWDHAAESDGERRTAPQAGLWYYDRIGFGGRELELNPDGTIGKGAASCEKRWTHRIIDGQSTVVIVGESHKGSDVGMMFLTGSDDGLWRGSWEYHERGPVAARSPAKAPPPGWTMRDGTWDRDIWDSVVRDNEYRLPEKFDPSDLILDIGAHIGSFSFACLRRGARVCAVEAERDNYRLLLTNLGQFSDRLLPMHAAAWSEPGIVSLYLPEGHANTGGWSVNGKGSQKSVAVRFDDLVSSLGRIRLCKLDCEGAEWEILRSSRQLHLIDEFCGEWHAGDKGDSATLEGILNEAGYSVQVVTTGERIGLFWAIRY